MSEPRHRLDKHAKPEQPAAEGHQAEQTPDAVGQPDLDPQTEDEKDRVEHHD